MSEQLTIEQATKRLEEIIGIMENSELSITNFVECYEETGKLLEFCYRQLEDCKLRIADVNDRIDALEKSGDKFDE